MDDAREEFRSLVGSLRAWLTWHESTGTSGIPRAPKGSVQSAPILREPISVQSAPVSVQNAPIPREPISVQSAPVSVRSAPISREPISVQSAPISVQSAPVSVQNALISPEPSSVQDARNPLVLRGNASHARVVFVAEAGNGAPLSEDLGMLLDRMIVAMGLDPTVDVTVITSSDDLVACSGFLHAQLPALAPKAIVALGEGASTALVGAALGAPPRGEWKVYRSQGFHAPMLPTLPLASFADGNDPRAKQAKKIVWDDLQKVMDQLGLPRPKRK